MGKFAKLVHKAKTFKEDLKQAKIEVEAEQEAKKEVELETKEAVKQDIKKEIRDEQEADNTGTSYETQRRPETNKGTSERKTSRNPFSGSRVEVKGRRVNEERPSRKFDREVGNIDQQVQALKKRLKEMGHDEHPEDTSS